MTVKELIKDLEALDSAELPVLVRTFRTENRTDDWGGMCMRSFCKDLDVGTVVKNVIIGQEERAQVLIYAD